MEKIKRNTQQTLTEQIRDWLLERIKTWDPSKPLPSQNELMRDFGVSLGPVSAALADLTRAGIIERHRGKGTFIKQRDLHHLSEHSVEIRASKKKVILVSLDTQSEIAWANNHHCEALLNKHLMDTVRLCVKQRSDLSSLKTLVEEVGEVSGLIISGSGMVTNRSHLQILESIGCPVALMEPCSLVDNHPLVFVTHPDYEGSGYLMAKHLLDNGHRRIAQVQEIPRHVDGPWALHWDGICRAFDEAGENPKEIVRLRCSSEVQYGGKSAYELTLSLLRQHPDLTALIFETGIGAAASVRAIHESGLRVPEDVSVIGEYDYKHVSFINPPITVTHFDAAVRAQAAVGFLLEPKLKQCKRFTPVALLNRKSVAKAKG